MSCVAAQQKSQLPTSARLPRLRVHHDAQPVGNSRNWRSRWVPYTSWLSRRSRPGAHELRFLPPWDILELQRYKRQSCSRLPRNNGQVCTLRRTRDAYRRSADPRRSPIDSGTCCKVVITTSADKSLADNGSREWTGYGTARNRDSALERWTSLASSPPNASRQIKARAHSCLAAGWFERATEDSERWNIDSLYRAGSNANEAISLGLISPVTLRTGFATETQGFRRSEDNRFPGLNTERFEQLAELWGAIDARTEEMNKASAKMDAKVSRAPLKYACSADDCGIQATKKSGLLRCAGKCPVVFKPCYCSKECQKTVLFLPPRPHCSKFTAVCPAGLETAQAVL